jgi:UDP-glucose 4-epimerase
MDTVLVTGGAGLIGSHVAEELVRMGLRTLVLDDLSGGQAAHVPEGAQLIRGSILDVPLVERIFRDETISVVYHLAAYAAEGLSHFIRRFNYTNNLVGSVNLLNCAIRHEVKCFVFTSSIAVYGENQLPYSEEIAPTPEDPYGIAKFAFEMDLHSALKMFGTNFIVFRPHNVYGERQNIADRYRNVVGIFMNRVMQGKPMPIFGDGKQSRAFTYISDVSMPIAHAGFMPETYNQAYNIGTDQPHTVYEVALKVAEAFGVEPQIDYVEARNEVVHAYSAHDKARAAFGKYIRNVPLAEGVGRMAKWAQSVGVGRSTVFEEIEIRKKLPPSWNV